MSELHRTNIYLFDSDVEYLRDTIGYGWSEKVRDLVHDYVKEQTKKYVAENGMSIAYEKWRALNRLEPKK